jgi:succinate-semialdehyde dehydrogenase / glutarate-semialdehyde dehydrogenase
MKYLTCYIIRAAEVPLVYPELFLIIDGEHVAASRRDSLPVLNPATEQEIGRLPVATDADLDRAVAAAERALPVWSGHTALQRYEILARASRLMQERASQIGAVLTLEQGKSLAEATREVSLSAEIILFLAEEGKRLYGRTVPPRTATLLMQHVTRVPIGPVAAFTPWNFPVNLPARKLGGALAAGCTCVIKAAEETPASFLEVLRCFEEAGLPPGVVNAVFGDPAHISSRLIDAAAIRKVSFTGSVSVGQLIAAQASRTLKRCTLELGGHAPVIVFADADVERAVRDLIPAKFRNAGQVCTSPTRFYVERSIYQRFVDAYTAAASALQVGDGSEQGTFVGPLAHSRRVTAMQSLVADALERKARATTGGKRLDRAGYFFPPTVLVDVPNEARVMQQEPFGPIATITPFDSAQQALDAANRLDFGLAAYVYTNDLTRAHDVSARLEAGMVGVNHTGVSMPETPFQGVKGSGYGSESGLEGLLGYTDVKLVSFSR